MREGQPRGLARVSGPPGLPPFAEPTDLSHLSAEADERRAKNLTEMTECVNSQLLEPWVAQRHKTSSLPLFISPAAYLFAVPWSFLGIARATLPAASQSTTGESLAVCTAFSGATMLCTMQKRSDQLSDSVAIFLDPTGDLPEVVTSAEALRAKYPDSVFVGEQASRARFMAAVRDVDLLAFIGHGRKHADQDTSSLRFSFRGELGTDDLMLSEPVATKRLRVALVLCCWGGQLGGQASMASWEAEGITYALKASGFDYIISALWPISPRVASSFLTTFFSAATKGGDIPDVFARTYAAMIDEYGLSTTIKEGASISYLYEATVGWTVEAALDPGIGG